MTPGPPSPPRARETVLAALLYLALTVLMTWPQAAQMNVALSDSGDAKLVARVLQWDYAQTRRDPLVLFQLNFFHPARYVLAFSENLFGVSLFGFPVLATGGSAVLNYNVLLLLGMFLSALAAWALARHVTGDPVASIVAGVVYAFLPWRMDQIPHLQHQWGAFLCLILLFLLRYLERGRRRDLALFTLAFAWNALANVYFAIFSGFLVAVTLVWFVLRETAERGARVRGVLAATVVGSLPFLPFAAGYRAAEKLYGFRRYLSEIDLYSGRWADFLSAGHHNQFWGPLTARWVAAEGQFFPGALSILLGVAAVVILWRARKRDAPTDTPPVPAGRPRRVAMRLADAGIGVLALVGLAAMLRPGLALGPVRVGDPGRVLVLLTAAVAARLLIAFPGRRYRNLADYLRRIGLEPRAALLLSLALCGVVVALGSHTPYYRFLVQTFGGIFRAIRAPSRGIVLFHVALSVLAAWGLSLLTRRRSPALRVMVSAAALAVLVIEYRAFPVPLFRTPSEPAPVYAWLRTAQFTGGVVEWPLGLRYDFEYVLRQTHHERPLVNGYSGFFPRGYVEVAEQVRQRPIPDTVWDSLEALDGRLMVLHMDSRASPLDLLEFVRLVRRSIAAGRVEAVGTFPHDGETDVILAPAGAPPVVPAPPGSPLQALNALSVADARIAPPIGDVTFPEPVSSGQWHGAWALDDSGIAEVRIASERGYEGSALLHMRMPGLFRNFPDYPEAKDDLGGFGFGIPDLPPGTHVLTFTLIANDGGRTILKRTVEIRPPPPRSPAPRRTLAPER